MLGSICPLAEIKTFSNKTHRHLLMQNNLEVV